jgi:hypothetical protein
MTYITPKMEEGVYLLRIPDGREIVAQLKRGRFYPLARQNLLDPSPSGGVSPYPILCSCTGTTKETATAMDATEAGGVCPKCGKTLAIVKTPADYRAEAEEREQRAREGLRLVFAGRTEDFGPAYRLTARLGRAEWEKIAPYMRYVTTDDELGLDADDHDLGWVTFHPAEVEAALGITGDRTIAAQQEAAKRHREDPTLAHKRAIVQRVKEIGAEIRKTGEKPEGTCSPEGDRLFDSQDIYGGGDWFVVGPEYLWYIQNNGMDGDNWSYNNVRTGGAGAIGYRVPASSPMTAELRRLASEIAALPGGECA